MFALISGLLTGYSLIIAIGAQNAFLIRQGLTRKYTAMIILQATASDVFLISVGTLGLGTLVVQLPWFLEIYPLGWCCLPAVVRNQLGAKGVCLRKPCCDFY
jgi:L-lysine exporter family protein LysE/ArgO